MLTDDERRQVETIAMGAVVRVVWVALFVGVVTTVAVQGWLRRQQVARLYAPSVLGESAEVVADGWYSLPVATRLEAIAAAKGTQQ